MWSRLTNKTSSAVRKRNTGGQGHQKDPEFSTPPPRKGIESKLDECHTQRSKSQPVSERKALSPAPTSGQRLAHRASAPYSVGLGLVFKKERIGNEERRQQRRKHPLNQKGAKKERKNRGCKSCKADSNYPGEKRYTPRPPRGPILPQTKSNNQNTR